MSHQLDQNIFENFKIVHQLAGSFSAQGNPMTDYVYFGPTHPFPRPKKRLVLEVENTGWSSPTLMFQVFSDDNKIFESHDIYQAIDAYNQL